MTPDQYSRRYLSNHELRQSLYPRRYDMDWLWNLGCFALLLLASAALYWG